MWPFDQCCILSLSRSTTGVAGRCSRVPDQHFRLGRIEARTPLHCSPDAAYAALPSALPPHGKQQRRVALMSQMVRA